MSKMNGHKRNGRQSAAAEEGFLEVVARGFECSSIDELAQRLGYSTALEMARSESYDNMFDYLTGPGGVGRFMRIQRELRQYTAA